jgi:glycosyltransferase involved in cell wall biosynthesis
MMNKLVTIGIPVYKRLHYLANVLAVVESQDYPMIELLVSDNGMNGIAVPEIIKRHYSRPFRFRQNSSTVGISVHFNQIVKAASGEYFVLLQDDDEISPNYVSELVYLLESHPKASVAIAKQEILNEAGIVVRQTTAAVPTIQSGPDFIRDAWHSCKYRYECFATFLAKTRDIRRCGGYPCFPSGSHNDNALLIKLSLNGYIALTIKCSFRWRVYDSSHGLSLSVGDLADDTRQFLQFLESDPRIVKFSATHPVEWKELKAILMRMAWETYSNRWKHLYRRRLTSMQWIRAAFAMPLIPAYYKDITFTLLAALKMTVGAWVKRFAQ